MSEMVSTPPTTSAYVSIEHVDMHFDIVRGGTANRIQALDDINLEIDRGEFVCFIGPSGCGKSTLLRIVDGLIRPTRGQVEVGGKICTSPRPDLGVVFQSFNLFPWRTVAANVALGLENQKMSKRERRATAGRWLELVGLAGFEDFYPGQLSGGMQQRVGLARALAIEPEILLMDEPFGSVDAQTRLIMQNELLRIWAGNRKTVIFVTHDVEEALFLGDRVVTFSQRPGHVLDVIDVPFPRPRLDTLRGDPDFALLKEQLWEKLKRDASRVDLDVGPAGPEPEESSGRRRILPFGRGRD
jgi:NitT/TauT family transport system ATP-binding protein